ncbi:MAG TPA: hypothetical protein VGM36_11395 [Rhizomicrobium sp.]|jgi:hypothetical protein
MNMPTHIATKPSHVVKEIGAAGAADEIESSPVIQAGVFQAG